MTTSIRASAQALDELFGLTGKVAWVTGGGRGIGRALAIGLARAGARVAVTARRADDLSALASELDDEEVYVLPGDVADARWVADAAVGVVDRFGTLDILVNAAGVSPTVRPSHELSDDEWHEVIDINLNGTFYCCREAGRHMVAKGTGSIVNFSSVHGSTGVARMAAYGASKGAVENLTRSLAIEWAPEGVRVNCLAPGYIETDMTHAYLRSRFGDEVRAAIPLGRPGNADDLVAATIFLAGDAAAYVTGAIIAVDGGWTAR